MQLFIVESIGTRSTGCLLEFVITGRDASVRELDYAVDNLEQIQDSYAM